MSRERFPIQDGPSVPWDFMVPHEAQCRINHGHTASIEHIAGRGGFGAAEAWCVVNGLKFYDALPDQKAIDEARQKWFELAERVNREWSIKRLLAEERERYLKRLREERGLFALSLQMLSGRDFAAADKLATMRFATWEEVNSEAEKARTLIRQLDTAPSSTEEKEKNDG